MTIFKATIKSINDSARMLTCALKSRRGKLMALIFYFTGKRKSAGSVEIDLTRYENIDATDLKNKVFRIIDGFLQQEDLCQGIRDAFNNEKAARILQESATTPHVQSNKTQGLKEAREMDSKRIDKMIDNASEMELRRMQIEEEIERIRKAANSQQFVSLEKVVVKGRRSRFSSPSNSENEEVQFEEDLSDGDEAAPDFKVEPIVIKEATVRKQLQGEQAIEDDNSSAYESQHSYKFRIEEKSAPVRVQRKVDMYTIIRVQSLIRGFIARRNGRKYPMVLFNRITN